MGEEEGMEETDCRTKEGATSHSLSLSHPHLDDCQKLQLHDPTRLRTRLFTPQGPFSQAVLDIFTSRFTAAENLNFTRGLCLHKDYVAGKEFVAWKGGCSSGRGPPSGSGSLGPVLPFDLGGGGGAPAAQGLVGEGLCWEQGWGLGWEAPWVSERRRRALPMRRGGCTKRSTCPYADTHLDAFPNQLTPMRDQLYLVDGGFAINSPFPLSLQPQRAVDLILSFDYSLDAPFEVRSAGGGRSLLRGSLAEWGSCLLGGLGF